MEESEREMEEGHARSPEGGSVVVLSACRGLMVVLKAIPDRGRQGKEEAAFCFAGKVWSFLFVLYSKCFVISRLRFGRLSHAG